MVWMRGPNTVACVRAAAAGEALRVTAERRLSTAVWTLTHPRTGRTVTLIGTMHVGDDGYFAAMSTLVEELAATGAEIHVEGISHRHDNAMRGWELNCLAAAYSWEDPETFGAAATLQVGSQGASLRLPEGVRNNDLSHVDLLRRIGWANYRRLFAPPLAEMPAVAAGRLARFGAEVARAAIRFRVRHRRTISRVKAIRGRNRMVNRVVIAERNRIAFAGAVEALSDRDVVLIWGADHLPGLARLFALQDYTLSETRWLDACAI